MKRTLYCLLAALLLIFCVSCTRAGQGDWKNDVIIVREPEQYSYAVSIEVTPISFGFRLFINDERNEVISMFPQGGDARALVDRIAAGGRRTRSATS